MKSSSKLCLVILNIVLHKVLVRNQFGTLCIKVLSLQEDTQYFDAAGINDLLSLPDDFLMVFWLFSDDSYAVNSVSQGIFTTGLISLLAKCY